jgi:hypothetical protein
MRGSESAAAAHGRNDLKGGRLAVGLITCNQLSVYAGTGLNGDGFVGDIAAYFTAVNQFNAFAGNNIADDFAGNGDVLCTNVAMNFSAGSDDDPARVTIRLLEVAFQLAINAHALVDMQRAFKSRGGTQHGADALQSLAM